MKHIKRDFSLKAGSDPLGVLRGCGQKVKIQLSHNMVVFHIKLKGITNAATYKHIFCPYTHPQPLGRDQRSKQYFFLKVVMLHINLKGTEHKAQCKHTFFPYIHPRPLGWGQKSIFF